MVGLSEDPEDAVRAGFTPEVLSHGDAKIADEHGMPIDTRVARADGRVGARLPRGRRDAPERTRPRARAAARAARAELQRRAARRARDDRRRGARRGDRPRATSRLDGRHRDPGRAGRRHGRRPRAHRRRARAGRPARRLVRRPALHVPVLRDRPRAADGVQLAAPGFQPFARLRRPHRQPRPRGRAPREARPTSRTSSNGPARRWPPARSPRSARSPTKRPTPSSSKSPPPRTSATPPSGRCTELGRQPGTRVSGGPAGQNPVAIRGSARSTRRAEPSVRLAWLFGPVGSGDRRSRTRYTKRQRSSAEDGAVGRDLPRDRDDRDRVQPTADGDRQPPEHCDARRAMCRRHASAGTTSAATPDQRMLWCQLVGRSAAECSWSGRRC